MVFKSESTWEEIQKRVCICHLNLPTELNLSTHLEYPDGSIPLVAKSNSGRMSPVRACTMKEYEQQMSELRKENFSLKLRIYILEERIQQKHGDDDIFKTNIELKVQLESLKKVVSEKDDLLKKASLFALDNLTTSCQDDLKKVQKNSENSDGDETEHLKDLCSEKNKEKETLAEQKRLIEQLMDDIKSQESELQQIKIEKQDELCKLEQSHIKTKEAMEMQLESKDRNIKEVANRVKQLEDELSLQDKQTLKRKKAIQGLTVSLLEKEKELECLRKKIQNDWDDLTKTKKDLSDKVRCYKVVQHELQEKEKLLQQLTKTLQDKDSQLQECTQFMPTSDNKLWRLIHQQLEELKQLKKTLHVEQRFSNGLKQMFPPHGFEMTENKFVALQEMKKQLEENMGRDKAQAEVNQQLPHFDFVDYSGENGMEIQSSSEEVSGIVQNNLQRFQINPKVFATAGTQTENMTEILTGAGTIFDQSLDGRLQIGADGHVSEDVALKRTAVTDRKVPANSASLIARASESSALRDKSPLKVSEDTENHSRVTNLKEEISNLKHELKIATNTISLLKDQTCLSARLETSMSRLSPELIVQMTNEIKRLRQEPKITGGKKYDARINQDTAMDMLSIIHSKWKNRMRKLRKMYSIFLESDLCLESSLRKCQSESCLVSIMMPSSRSLDHFEFEISGCTQQLNDGMTHDALELHPHQLGFEKLVSSLHKHNCTNEENNDKYFVFNDASRFTCTSSSLIANDVAGETDFVKSAIVERSCDAFGILKICKRLKDYLSEVEHFMEINICSLRTKNEIKDKLIKMKQTVHQLLFLLQGLAKSTASEADVTEECMEQVSTSQSLLQDPQVILKEGTEILAQDEFDCAESVCEKNAKIKKLQICNEMLLQEIDKRKQEIKRKLFLTGGSVEVMETERWADTCSLVDITNGKRSLHLCFAFGNFVLKQVENSLKEQLVEGRRLITMLKMELSTFQQFEAKNDADSLVCLSSEIHSLFAICKLDDYELLKRENLEIWNVVHGLEAQIKERLSFFRCSASLQNLEYSTLRELSLAMQNLQICLSQETHLIGKFWVSQLPPKKRKGDCRNSEFQRENERLKIELNCLRLKCDRIIHLAKENEDKCYLTKRMKNKMEDAVSHQLKRTEKVLGCARSNMENAKQSMRYLTQNK